MNKINRAELIKKAQEITASGLPFMEGKDKIELEDGQLYIVKYFGYLEADGHDFVVIGDDTTFAFGGQVITDNFKKLEQQFTEDEISQLLVDGIDIEIRKVKSRTNKRDYTACTFFPSDGIETF
jgi:hypothetical protein